MGWISRWQYLRRARRLERAMISCLLGDGTRQRGFGSPPFSSASDRRSLTPRCGAERRARAHLPRDMAAVIEPSIPDATPELHHPGTVEISSSDLSAIERLLSRIADNTGSLVSSNPGGDIRAVVNRLEEANRHLSTIASNTRR